MTPSDHGRPPLARLVLAAGGIAALAAVCECADLAARYFGALAGAALICAVFAACWAVRRVRPLLRPVPPARCGGTREAEVTAEPPALAGTATAG